MRLEITPKQLYVIGIFCFSIAGLANLVNFFIFFGQTNIFSKIATLGGIIFNFALVGLFKYLLSLEPKITDEVASDDIDEIIKEVTNGGKKRKA